MFDRDFIEEQIADLEEQLSENRLALRAARKSQTHSMNTGQTQQSVSRQPLASLSNERLRILAELDHWKSMLCGGGGHVATPVW